MSLSFVGVFQIDPIEIGFIGFDLADIFPRLGDLFLDVFDDRILLAKPHARQIIKLRDLMNAVLPKGGKGVVVDAESKRVIGMLRMKIRMERFHPRTEEPPDFA